MENTLFFGNGLNQIGNEDYSWNNILEELKTSDKFENANMPNTLIYERILSQSAEHISLSERSSVKEHIALKMKNLKPNKLYEDITKLNFSNFITTNYDSTLEKSTSGVYTVNDSSNEKLYSIRRNKVFSKDDQPKFKLWQIHGYIDRPSTIMLGYNHYCGSVGKIDSYLKGTYRDSDGKKINNSIDEKIEQSQYDNISWIELFFNSNIFIIGFSLDYSEIDLWWIINKRERLIREGKLKIENKIYFYDKKLLTDLKESLTEKENLKMKNEIAKRELLKSFHVEVIEIDFNGSYENLYINILSDLKTKM